MTSLLDRPILEIDWLKEVGERNGTSPAPARLHGVNGEQKVVSDAGPWEPAVQKKKLFSFVETCGKAANCCGLVSGPKPRPGPKVSYAPPVLKETFGRLPWAGQETGPKLI